MVEKAFVHFGWGATSLRAEDLRAISWDGSNVLPNDAAGGFRNVGKDLANFANSPVFWPPPLTSPSQHADASLCWEVQLSDEEVLDNDLWKELTEDTRLGSCALVSLFRR